MVSSLIANADCNTACRMYSSEFEYNKNTTIVSPLIQHLSNVFGDKARIYSDSSLQSSSLYSIINNNASNTII